MKTKTAKPARFPASMMKRLRGIVPPPGIIYNTSNGVTVARPSLRSLASMRKQLGPEGMWITYQNGKRAKPSIVHFSNRTDQEIGLRLIRLGIALCGHGRRRR